MNRVSDTVRAAIESAVKALIGAPPYAADSRDAGWDTGAGRPAEGDAR